MLIYIIMGWFGLGKSFVIVGCICDLFVEGWLVVINLDLNFEKLCGLKVKILCVVCLLDKLMVVYFDSLGWGNESYDEIKNGGIFFDEVL